MRTREDSINAINVTLRNRLNTDINDLMSPDKAGSQAMRLQFVIGDCLDIIREATALLSNGGEV